MDVNNYIYRRIFILHVHAFSKQSIYSQNKKKPTKAAHTPSSRASIANDTIRIFQYQFDFYIMFYTSSVDFTMLLSRKQRQK